MTRRLNYVGMIFACELIAVLSMFGQEAEPTEKPTFITPPAPVLRPDEELKTFEMLPGYRLELVAADPLIMDPVAMTFDPDGRIWVCEMRGFMPDIEGTNENAPVGVVSVLDDTDGDGVMDKSTVFADGFVLPRGLCWTTDGILICENGTIWLYKDVDGDDRHDRREVVCNYNAGNLEHALNGLMPALDNWVYNAKEGIRLRRVKGRWVSQTNAARGQWGITQDDQGYLYYNVNASLLRGDLVPCYSSIAQSNNPLVDVQLYDSQEVFPIRPTPGVNRGYVRGFLRDDGSLIEANSNCGPVVYRGDNLPDELVGNVFIPEPAGNLIRRQVIVNESGRRTSKNAYDKKEFLASRDERFRPVNMYNAPDGTLYVVDMYRGIIQHGAFITPYLREQILDRKLDQEINRGRIFRIVHDSTEPRKPLAMSKLGSEALVKQLSNSNGWNRDMAQQLLVQRGDETAIELLTKLVLSGDNPLGRLHALWTLEGLKQIDIEMLYELLSDTDANLRASAVTLYARYLVNDSVVPTIVEDVSEVAADGVELVRQQVVQTLGLIQTADADRGIESILKNATADEKKLHGLIGGFAGNATEFLTARLAQPSWQQRTDWREKVLATSASIMWYQRDPMAVLRFCHLVNSIPNEHAWQQVALLEGVKDPPRPERKLPSWYRPSSGAKSTRVSNATSNGDGSPGEQPRRPFRSFLFGGRPKAVKLNDTPEGLDELRQSSNARLAKAANTFADKLIWPGKDGKSIPEKPSLTIAQQHLYELGKVQYMSVCAGCHHSAGYGLTAKGPPLMDSNRLADDKKAIRIVLHGIQGPLAIDGELYNVDSRLSMPGISRLMDDEKLAGVLTYARREFLDDAGVIEIKAVADVRTQTESRTEPWTEMELNDETNR